MKADAAGSDASNDIFPTREYVDAFIANAVAVLRADVRVRGVAIAGSHADATSDAYSDVDLIVAVEAGELVSREERVAVVERLGPLAAAFTGEHVGDPRVLITLYGPPALHVDFKFAEAPAVRDRIDEPRVLWERDTTLSAELAASVPRTLDPDPQWLEDRFWVWVHYATTKIGRGEYFEAIDFLACMREQVLAPLHRRNLGIAGRGLRRIEQDDPAFARSMVDTLATPDRVDLVRAVRACIDLYRGLRRDVATRDEAELLAVDYLGAVAAMSGVGSIAGTPSR